MSQGPGIETKVIAAAGGSGLGAALSTFLLWLLGVTVFGGSASADQVAHAVAAVPEPVGGLLVIIVAIAGAAAAGYAAPHTSRPDLGVVLTPSLGTFTAPASSPGGLVSSGSTVVIGPEPEAPVVPPAVIT